MKTHSIARRLIATVLLVELVSALCVTGLAWIYERHIHFRAFDILLRGRADSLLGSVQDAEDPADNVMLDKSDLNVPSEDIYEVRDEKGRLLGRSPNWDGSAAQTLTSRADGYFTLKITGKHYRTLLLHGLRVVDPGDKGGGVPRHVIIIYGSPTSRVWKAVTGAVKFYTVASFLLLAITGFVVAWLLNRSLASLRELAAEAGSVSVNAWQFNPPEKARATKELAPLVKALETTLQRLERSFLQQRHFISDAAHELKTAVAVVKSSLQLLGMKQRSAAEYQAGLERCESDCGRMEEIVAKMLTLARAENNAETKSHQIVTTTNISNTLRQVAEQFQSMAELRGVAVVLSTHQDILVSLASEECTLVLSNLLLNALQHSRRDTTILASAFRQGGIVEIRVEDQGDGIDSVALPHVFERFYRGDPSRNRNTGGTGLGLSICKAIVDGAGGEIHIDSLPDIGTAVMVILPVASQAQDADPLSRIETRL
jgi:signal transduction histidine kinase